MITEAPEDILTVLKSHIPDPRKPLALVRKEFSEFYEEHLSGENPETGRVTINPDLDGYWIQVPESSPERIVLFFHGGGFSLGSTRDHLGFCARIARASRSTVFSVDYRLAPEHIFPAQVSDAVAAYQYLIGKGIPPHRIVPVGISAGGTLVIDLLLSARDLRLPLPMAAVCMSPAVDMMFSGESVKTNEGLDSINPARLDAIRTTYLAGHDPHDPVASPIYARLSGLPRMYIQAGTHELLLSSIASFVDKARWAGVPVQFELWEGMFHGWQIFSRDVSEGKRAIDHVGAFIQDVLVR